MRHLVQEKNHYNAMRVGEWSAVSDQWPATGGQWQIKRGWAVRQAQGKPTLLPETSRARPIGTDRLAGAANPCGAKRRAQAFLPVLRKWSI